MTEAPAEIFKHCLACRRETLHARVPGVARLLYACACGAPAREVSEPERSAPAAKMRERLEHDALQRKIDKEDDPLKKTKPPTSPSLERSVPMPRPKQAAPPENPFLRAVDRRVDARLAAFKAALGPAITAELAKLLGEDDAATAPKTGAGGLALPAGFACVRTHTGPCRRKCLKAAGVEA